MAIKRVFKCAQPHMVFVTKKGKNLYFKDHRLVIDDALDIAELEDEIKSQHPHIYIDPVEKEIDTSLQDKIAEAQKAAVLAVMQEHGEKKLAELVPEVPKAQTMSPATLLGVTSSAALTGLSAQSNQK